MTLQVNLRGQHVVHRSRIRFGGAYLYRKVWSGGHVMLYRRREEGVALVREEITEADWANALSATDGLVETYLEGE